MEKYTKDTVIDHLYIRSGVQRGAAYYYVYQKNGKKIRMRLGLLKSMTRAEARKIAKEKNILLAMGGNPATYAYSIKGKPTMQTLFDAWHKEIGQHKKTAKEDKRKWEKYCGDIHNTLTSEITKFEVSATIAKLADTPIMANRVLSFISTLCNYGMTEHGYEMPRNPCAGIRRHREARRERYLTKDEWLRFTDALERNKRQSPDSVCFLLLLAYTGARKGEIANMRWSDIRGDVVELAEHKTDKTGDVRRIYLPEPALEIIRTLPRRSLDDRVLGVKCPRRMFERILREAGIEDLRMHDLRHNFASVGANSGMTLQEVGKLLGHRSTSTTQRYAHLFDERLREGANLIADALAVNTRR